MSTVVIRFDGVDITPNIEFPTADFVMYVGGQPGSCAFTVKDTGHDFSFGAGKEITVDVDAVRVWGGYATKVSRVFAFDVDDTSVPEQTARLWRIEGFDYNILLQRRIAYMHDGGGDPVPIRLNWYGAKDVPSGTNDATVVSYIIDTLSDLADDGVTTDIVSVVTPYPDQDGALGAPGWPINQVLSMANQNVNAIYYIDTLKVFHWHDADTPTSSYTLTDHPVTPSEYGIREMAILNNGSDMAVEVLVWGAGTGSQGLPTFAKAFDLTAYYLHGEVYWQHSEWQGGLYHQSKVQQYANYRLNGTPQNHRGLSYDKFAWQCAVYEPVFFCGDKVQVRSDVFGSIVSDVVPVRRMHITFPTPTDAKFDLTLSHERDNPWDYYEFYFPPLPTIVIPVPGDQFPYCPAPGSGMVVIWGDNFDRATRSPAPPGGWWTNSEAFGAQHVSVSIGQSNDKTYPYLNTFTTIGVFRTDHVSVGVPFEVVVAIDASKDGLALGGTASAVSVGSLFITLNPFTHRFTLSAQADPGTITTDAPLDIKYASKIYIRVGRKSQHSAYASLWRQDEPESSAILLEIDDPSLRPGGFSWADITSAYLMGITVYGPDHSIAIPSYQNGVWDYLLTDLEENNLLASTTGWTGDWQIEDGNYAPSAIPGNIYAWGVTGAPSAGVYLGGSAGSGTGGGSAEFGPPVNPNIGLSHGEGVSVIELNPLLPIPDYTVITGQVLTYSHHHSIFGSTPTGGGPAIELMLFETFSGLDGGNPVPYQYNYGLLGRVVQTLGSGGDIDVDLTDAAWQDFRIVVNWNESFGLNKILRWGARGQSEVDLVNSYPARSGFFVPSGLDAGVSVRNVKYLAHFPAQGIGHPFCLAHQGGGITSLKFCEVLRPSARAIELEIDWHSQTSDPYESGTLEVSLDGVRLRPGVDFVESNYKTGAFTVYGPVANVLTARVCYFARSPRDRGDLFLQPS